MLNTRDPVTFEASLRDAYKGRSRLVFECLEKALLLRDDIQELKGLRKCKVFLSLKRDLVKVIFYTSALIPLPHILYVKTVTCVCFFP